MEILYLWPSRCHGRPSQDRQPLPCPADTSGTPAHCRSVSFVGSPQLLFCFHPLSLLGDLSSFDLVTYFFFPSCTILGGGVATLGVSASSQLILAAMSPGGGCIQPPSAAFSPRHLPHPPLVLLTFCAHPPGPTPLLLVLTVSGSHPLLFMFAISGSHPLLLMFTISGSHPLLLVLTISG